MPRTAIGATEVNLVQILEIRLRQREEDFLNLAQVQVRLTEAKKLLAG